MMQIEGDEQCADILRLHSASDLRAGETNFRSDLNNILRLDSAPEQFGENDESPDTAAPAEEGADGPSDIMRIHTSEEGALSPLSFCVALTDCLPVRRCMIRSQLFFSQHFSSVCVTLTHALPGVQPCLTLCLSVLVRSTLDSFSSMFSLFLTVCITLCRSVCSTLCSRAWLTIRDLVTGWLTVLVG